MLSFYVFLQNNIEEDQKLGEMKMFFAQKTPLQDALFKYLQELDQQAGVASGLIINFFKKLILTCADNFGKGKFVMPSEKEDYLKIISCCLKFIMRSEKKFESNNQIFSKCFKDEEKKQIIKCFKSISVLKDFGDVPIDENQLLVDMTGKGSDKQNSLHDRLQEFEREHGAIVCRIMDLVRNYNLMTERAMRLQADEVFENYMDNVARQWYDVAVRALKCLENITGAILSLYAWKLCHGKALEDDTITSYSKVTRYNYDAEEKTDMTIAIGLAKGLQNVMIKYEEIFSFLIGRHCFSRLHDVIDRVIPELADKIKVCVC
ncbi:cytoplasmic FMR1-interacting protein 1-like [Convolutriloba macropyga]|uniref:cytoplasmic FMR1-interacting protein 1-like n=1 Tax=Convolutriloba macropyga TaxID=536237 RepID=UPI003F524AF4